MLQCKLFQFVPLPELQNTGKTHWKIFHMAQSPSAAPVARTVEAGKTLSEQGRGNGSRVEGGSQGWGVWVCVCVQFPSATKLHGAIWGIGKEKLSQDFFSQMMNFIPFHPFLRGIG